MKRCRHLYKNDLPQHAQDIYREAFNHAYATYQNPDNKRDKSNSVEEISHRVAWNAVKSKYEKGKDTIWRKKD